MAVIVKYVVERDGEEKMTFASKAEADAYDKMLDIADELEGVLRASGLIEDDGVSEGLALYLAEQKEAVMQALKGKKKAPPAAKAPAKKAAKAPAEKAA
ncbi:YebG family protein [Ferrimonas sp. SCSIO 43195]|uniref:YebG family protein n=1 Tax=Ferrimonas sp. SCSIO 43195 TaxID=2822844 RepID=UPI002075DC00|nr:YebG family protein [Ferrimonas sp. SCSIO 43195]USD36224.1 YebG family protein [Ferrimonas sp. SCSIO 43195]